MNDFACLNDYDERYEETLMSEAPKKEATPELTITIRKTAEKYGWEVRCGDRYEDRLGADEALWCIVQILKDERGTYLRSQEEHDALNARYGPKEPLELWQKQLAPSEGKSHEQ